MISPSHTTFGGTLFRYAVAAVALALGVLSAKNFYGALSTVKSSGLSSLEGAEQRARLADFMGSDDVEKLRSVAAYEAGRGEHAASQNEKIDAWCDSLAYYGKALVKEPFSSRTLLNWANIRQLLGSVKCKQEYTAGKFADVATFAIKQDPSDINNRYIAGLLLYWSGDEERAAQEFQFVLRYGVGLDDLRRNQIFTITSKPELLRQAIPARLPQAVQYLNWFERQSAKGEFWSERLARSSEFRDFKNETLAAVSKAVDDRMVPQEVLVQELVQLENFSIASADLQKINAMYETLFKSDKDNGFWQLVKQRLDESPIVAQLGYVGADTRVTKNAITQWGSGYEGTLDAYHASVGIFTRVGDVPQHLEINCGARESLDLQPLQLQLYVSSDNLQFTDITQETSITPVRNGLQALFKIDTSKVNLAPATGGRYWKVHFNASSRQGFCSGRLKDLVRIYGKASASSLDDTL